MWLPVDTDKLCSIQHGDKNMTWKLAAPPSPVTGWHGNLFLLVPQILLMWKIKPMEGTGLLFHSKFRFFTTFYFGVDLLKVAISIFPINWEWVEFCFQTPKTHNEAAPAVSLPFLSEVMLLLAEKLTRTPVSLSRQFVPKIYNSGQFIPKWPHSNPHSFIWSHNLESLWTFLFLLFWKKGAVLWETPALRWIGWIEYIVLSHCHRAQISAINKC